MSLGKVVESLGLNKNGSLPDDISTAPAGTLVKRLSDDANQTKTTVENVIQAVGLNTNGTAPTGTDVRADLAAEISARTAADAVVQSTAATDASTKANAAQAAAIAASAPIAHVGAGGTAHANATTSVAGFMSATDKALLDGATVSANANSIVKRDANGYISQLATVARTGVYGDLNGRPTVVSAFTNDLGYQTSAQVAAASITGNASTATALQTARTINGVSFNGTANIAVTPNWSMNQFDANQLTMTINIGGSTGNTSVIPLATPSFAGVLSGADKTKLNALSGTNTGDQILPTTLPASDVYAWAKAATKPTYTAAEVGALASITSGNVTTALGFTPYNATNPNNYIASSYTFSMGDLNGTIGASTVRAIQGVSVNSSAPTTNQVLAYSGTQWIPTTLSYLPNTGGSLSGRVDLKNYTEAKPAVTYAATTYLDLSTGTCFDLTLTGNVTFVFTNCPAVANTMFSFTLIVRQDATGSRTATFPTNRPQGSVALALTTTANKADIISWMTTDGGTTWFTSLSKNY